MINLVYPEKRRVTTQQIATWWHDAVDNGQIDRAARHGDEIVTNDMMVADLEDIGFISRGKD